MKSGILFVAALVFAGACSRASSQPIGSAKDHERLLRHVGGLKPGESKPLPPWPEPAEK